MYCPECGYKIEDKDALFCPECGTKVDEEMVQAEPRSHSQSLYGIILTNVSLLAQKFKVSESDVHTCLEHFIQEKEKFGVHYQLVDVSCYAYRKKNILGFPKKLCLKGQASVWTCMDVLMDIHNEEVKEEKPLSRYLFIIGGDDIIPMPCVRHFANDCPDATIDTDILYTYPYGEKALAMLEEGTLFEWNPLFVVGRLPIEKDTSMEDWCGYLERVLKNSGGIPAKGAYAQCDPNWKSVSATVADGLIENDWLRNLDGHLPSDYYFRRLILSPRIDAGSVEQVFRPDASLYYYNLHGSDVLEERAYFGRTTSKLSDFPVLYPEHMSTCTSPNVVVCEACYGARFIGLDKWHSMLLASIYSETLLYGKSGLCFAVKGDDVYCLFEKDDKTYLSKNGEITDVGLKTWTGFAGPHFQTLFVDGEDVYIVGQQNGVAKIWKNGVLSLLTTIENQCALTGICVYDKVVYVVGYDFVYDENQNQSTVMKLWKNGKESVIEHSWSHAYPFGIVVASK